MEPVFGRVVVGPPTVRMARLPDLESLPEDAQYVLLGSVDPVAADRRATLAFLESEHRRYMDRPGQWASHAVVDLLARALREKWGME